VLLEYIGYIFLYFYVIAGLVWIIKYGINSYQFNIMRKKTKLSQESLSYKKELNQFLDEIGITSIEKE
jgi:hypothetical protein